MTFTKTQAKTLLDRGEMELYESSLPAQLKSLTVVELKELVSRSRTTRDKWRDLAKRQRRESQARARARQTDENARSADKAKLLGEVHQRFVERLAAAEAGEVKVPAGKKARVLPRSERKVVSRVSRSIVRDKLARVEERMAVDKRMARQSKAGKKASSGKAAGGGNASKAKVGGSSSSAKKSVKKAEGKTMKKSVKKSAKKSAIDSGQAGSRTTKKTAKKSAEKSASTKKGTKKKAAVSSRGRQQALAKRATSAAKNAAETSTTSQKAPTRQPDSEGLSRAQLASNRSLNAKATKQRVLVGGGTRIHSHVAAKNRRQQSRRDSR